ncbi:MAG: ABC transporter ATP-binding protein [Xenococcaceae cyanobacterium MO_188.B29]|nr:ABC transporter ATP-binding protein [Xenococcaceae cyanobacterium MO_188.B29]
MIEVEHLSKTYGSTTAIEDIYFSVEKGEIIGFLGPNGAGKTTTMRILAGYLPATAGTAKIAGYDVHKQSMQVRRRVGYLPENPPLYPEMTVESFLHFVAKIKGVRKGDRVAKVDSAIQRCQLVERRTDIIRKLSKGYRQRVGIAQAIVHEPPVIILDEPTVGLDPRQIIEVRNLIKSLAGEHTIILSTHILPEVSMTCDRVTIVNRGKVVATNTPSLLMEQLKGSSGYEVEIEGDRENIIDLLQKISGVSTVEIDRTKCNLQPNRTLLQINCTTETEPGKEIAATIVERGLGLLEMRRTSLSLEDVFLQLTTEESTVDEENN